MDLGEKWEKEQAAQLNGQVLAFIGDAVHTLVVRCDLTREHDARSGELHKLAAEEVSAVAQAKRFDRICGTLTEEETAVFKRGRNTKVNSVAKNASVAEYMKATGFEAVLGYLYLTGDTPRLLELIRG